VRSYERGERVYEAMLARGYTGEMPTVRGAAATRRDWIISLSVPISSWIVAIVSVIVT
ncbi:MAG: cobalt ECF transporter T component CbiQ, partial [Actinobacteria bacterium]